MKKTWIYLVAFLIAAGNVNFILADVRQSGSRKSGGGAGGVTFPLLAPAGSVGAPPYSFAADTDTGILRNGTVGGLSIITDNAERYNFATTRLLIDASSQIAWSGTNITQPADTGLARASAGAVRVTDGGAGHGSIRVTQGAAAGPGFAFAADADTGIYAQASGGICIDADGVARLCVDGNGVALTESSATNVALFNISSNNVAGGYVDYTVVAADATVDVQARTGRVFFQGVNKAGTETCVVSGTAGNVNPTEAQDGSSPAVSAGTLTYTWGVSTSPTSGCQLTLTAVSSLTQTVLQIYPIISFHTSGGSLVHN